MALSNEMIDRFTLDECRREKDVLEIKIKNVLHAIIQSERIISESEVDEKTLSFLKRRISESQQDLEILYLLRSEDD